ncbi:sugar transferase [bacterium]|nr:sugar transferase [bacterium]MCB2202216.1 sugar transferase [bacterium]
MIQRATKRTCDIVGALVGLIICLPIMIVVPIIIKLDSRGPVFYTQTRIGVNRRKGDRRYHQKTNVEDQRSNDRRKENLMGKPFKVIKFRTMVQDAEKKSGPVWATKGDPRITRLGRFLRKSRIDEIPQFLNVLMGDMALVGPRPERPTFVKDLSTKIDGYADRLRVKPGITGLAQIESGYDSDLDSVKEKIGHDVEYIRTMSLWTDVKIMARTVIVVFTGKGAC